TRSKRDWSSDVCSSDLQPGASEWLDVSGYQNGYVDTQNQQPGYVQQSTAAVLDQSTAAVLDGGPYTAFGHGTMTTGLVHLVAPKIGRASCRERVGIAVC